MLDRPDEAPRGGAHRNGNDPDAPDPVRIPTGGAKPDRVRERQLAEIRKRLARGELDSERALRETALALLDSDVFGR